MKTRTYNGPFPRPGDGNPYDDAIKMLGTPAIESMVKTIQNLQKDKDTKEEMVKKLEMDLHSAKNHLETVKSHLEDVS